MTAVRRAAVLCDIHGNLPALEAVLADLAAYAPDAVVIGGDALSGPFPVETLARLTTIPGAVFVRGNADRGVVEAFDGVRDAGQDPPDPPDPMDVWTATQLDRPARNVLASWPATVVLHVEGLGAVRFCHASPRSDVEVLTVRTPQERLAAALHDVPERIVVCGHTHMPFDRRVGARRVINAGSVGMPYGEPGAHWLLLGPGIRPMRTAYDRQAAAERIRHSRWPGAAAFARENILQTPTAAEALAALEPPR